MTLKKLTYFNAKGRAEIIRFVLSALNEKFEDERLSFEEWGSKKATTKYSQLPILTLEDGTVMNESLAIAKYLARKGHLYGNNEWETYLVDRAIDTITDLYLKAMQAHFEKCEQKKEELTKELKEKFVPLYLGKMTSYVEEAKGDFLTGAKPTVADLYLCCVVENFPDARSNFAKVDKICNQLMKVYPGLKQYIDNRPQTQF